MRFDIDTYREILDTLTRNKIYARGTHRWRQGTEREAQQQL